MVRDEMTLDRLAELLDAYGARPERWPDAERPAALALLQRSAEARAHRDAAAALDALLDRAPALEPSAALAGRILARAPRGKVVPLSHRMPRSRAGLVAAVGLAAAASLAVWLVRQPTRQLALDAAELAQLGEYETPTDALLSALELDTDGTLPQFGCDDPDVGCDEPEVPAPRPSATRSRSRKEMQA